MDTHLIHGAYIVGAAKGKKLKEQEAQRILKLRKEKEIKHIENAELTDSDEELKINLMPENLKVEEAELFPSQFRNTLFIFEENCPKCSRVLQADEIISGWKKSYQDYITKCPTPNCQTHFIAKFNL